MKYSFKDLVDIPRLQELTDELYAAASIPSAIITLEGEVLTGAGRQKICTDFHRRHPQLERECIQSNTAIRKKLDQGEPFVIYKCPRGLIDASTPIIITGEHMANVFFGQIFIQPPDRIVERFFRDQARRFDFNETAYMRAFKQIPVFTEKRFQAGIAFLVKLARLVADMGLARLKELEAVALLRQSESRYRQLFEMESGADIAFRIKAEQERPELDRRARQARKMEAIGNLAGGIAHDFNDILGPIVGMAELLRDDLPPGSVERENSREILKAGLRGRDLVKQILAFSRRSKPQMAPVRFQRVLREAVELSRASIASDIAISQDIQNDCGLIMADPTQLRRIAINLITNAYHAVKLSGGRIEIRLKETGLAESRPDKESPGPGRYAVFSVGDTGGGMEPRELERIFEPYFTTEASGKGTGLGLAVVHGIVKDHGGDIKVRSQPGRGTTFRVYLPIMEKNAQGSGNDILEPRKAGREHILVVDDEEPIVRLERQMLERMGYRVTVYSSSMEALEAFKTDPTAFDLVLTDLTMPTMTGDRLARELLSMRPELPIVICTGFSEHFNRESALIVGAKGFLLKPIVRTELARTIRTLLDGTSRGDRQP